MGTQRDDDGVWNKRQRCIYNPRDNRNPRPCTEVWHKQGTISPSQPAHNPANTLMSHFWPPHWERIKFHCSQPPTLCYFVITALGTSTTPHCLSPHLPPPGRGSRRGLLLVQAPGHRRDSSSCPPYTVAITNRVVNAHCMLSTQKFISLRGKWGCLPTARHREFCLSRNNLTARPITPTFEVKVTFLRDPWILSRRIKTWGKYLLCRYLLKTGKHLKCMFHI